MKIKNLNYTMPLIIPYNGIINGKNKEEQFSMFSIMVEKLNDVFNDELEKHNFDTEKLPKYTIGDHISVSFEDFKEEPEKYIIFSMCFYNIQIKCIEGVPKRRDLHKAIESFRDYFLNKYYALYIKISENQKYIAENITLENDIDKIINEINSVLIYYTVGLKDKRVFEIKADLYYSAYEDTLIYLAEKEISENNLIIN